MSLRPKRLSLALASASVLVLAACGGSGGGGTSTVIPPSATTAVSTTVVDGAIKDALVCIDKNGNGACDTGEVQGRTDAAGNVTLAVPNGDVGKYPLIALVGTDAVDADHGPVATAYTMSAPADRVGVVSPLTTLVQQTVASTGASTAEAAASVQGATGISTSLFQDFTKVPAPTDGSVSAAAVARLLVVTTQQQSAAVSTAVGTSAADGTTITRADLDKAVQNKLIELLPSLVAALSNPAVTAAATPADKEAALLSAATALVSSEGLTAQAVATVVAINNQAATPTPPPSPAEGFNIDALSFSDASNYYHRIFGASLAQATPDANNLVHYTERRTRAVAGVVAKWGSGADPLRGSDLNWNGSEWASCPINYANTNTVRDAQGNSDYGYCNKRESGKSQRATFDISGKKLIDVYNQITAAGYTNLSIANAATALGSTATFPTGSALFYQHNTSLVPAVSYNPSGANSPVGVSNVATQYSAAVAAGGDATTQADGQGCNTFTMSNTTPSVKVYERNTNGINSTTLESMIAAKQGTPCVYAPATFTYNGTVYSTTDANAAWGTATVSLGKIGTTPLNSGTAPGFYSGNTWIRAAFTAPGVATYYVCKERFDNGNIRACVAIGTGSYAIQTLGDARVLSFTNLPLESAALTYTRAFVERGGFVYYGYVPKTAVSNHARFNGVGTTALFAQLGLPAPDAPATPLALTTASYQGVWDFRTAGTAVSPTNGITVFIGAGGTASCTDKQTGTGFACVVSITDTATGAFSFSDGGSVTGTGTLDFLSGTASAVFTDPTATPSTESVVGGRR